MRSAARFAGPIAASMLLTIGAAQTVAGRVAGFAGEPAEHAVVTVLDGTGFPLRELLTDADGGFAYTAPVPLGSVLVQIEGVELAVAVRNGADAALRVSFERTPHFTLRGHLVDPGGVPARGTDLVWRDARQRAIATVTTDDRGAFAIRMGRAAADVLVDPLGLGHVEPGPFAADRGLAIDLRLKRDDYFCLQGAVLDATGAAAGGVRVEAIGDERRVAWTTTDAGGRFVLWSRRPVDHLTAKTATGGIHLPGPWRAAATASLDEREDGLVLVAGRLVDVTGKPIGRASLYAVDLRAPPPNGRKPLGATFGDGSFAVLVPRSAPFLCAQGDRVRVFAAGPWTRAPIELRPGR